MFHYESLPVTNEHLIYIHFYTGKTQEQEALVADDLNLLLLGLLRSFVQKTVGHCKISFKLAMTSQSSSAKLTFLGIILVLRLLILPSIADSILFFPQILNALEKSCLSNSFRPMTICFGFLPEYINRFSVPRNFSNNFSKNY